MRCGNVLLSILLLACGSTHAANVYKCTGPDGTPVYLQTPCTEGQEPMKLRDSSFGERRAAAEVHLEDFACLSEYGYTKGSGKLHNVTGDVHAVEVTVTFTRSGTVVDQVSLREIVAPYSSVPFIAHGGRYGADSCLASVTLRQ